MIDQQILDFIAEHHVLTVACVGDGAATGEPAAPPTGASGTATAGGSAAVAVGPWCANAFYVFDAQEEGFIITSEVKTRHAQLFLENPQVAGTVVLETEEVGKIRGLQFTGTVRRCDGGLFDRCRLLYLRRFPYAVFKGGEVWLIRLDTLKYTDNRLGFGKKLHWSR